MAHALHRLQLVVTIRRVQQLSTVLIVDAAAARLLGIQARTLRKKLNHSEPLSSDT